MSDINIKKAHNQDFLTARQNAKKWLDDLNARFNLDAQYQEGDGVDTIRVDAKGVNATATIDASDVSFSAKLGLFAKPLKGHIEAGVKDGFGQYFG